MSQIVLPPFSLICTCRYPACYQVPLNVPKLGVNGNKKVISLLGSTGSIGTQTLDIVGEHPDKFQVVALSAGNNLELVAEQVRRREPLQGWMQ